AAKHVPNEGLIRISSESFDDSISISVMNSGEGIDPSDVDHVFHRFAQSSRSRFRRFGSTGLGLAVVKELVELHGGSVRIDNVPGQYVAFVVTLPLRKEPSAPATPYLPTRVNE